MINYIIVIFFKFLLNTNKNNMSSELHKYIENAIEKKENLFKSEVLDFPRDRKIKISKNFKLENRNHWNIKDNSNSDQLKAITGICLLFSFLLIMGIFANLTFL